MIAVRCGASSSKASSVDIFVEKASSVEMYVRKASSVEVFGVVGNICLSKKRRR